MTRVELLISILAPVVGCWEAMGRKKSKWVLPKLLHICHILHSCSAEAFGSEAAGEWADLNNLTVGNCLRRTWASKYICEHSSCLVQN